MRLREAFESVALPNLVHSVKTTKAHRHNLNRWERHSCDPPIKSITTETFRQYRQTCRAKGLSPDTIEGDVRTAMVTLRMAERLGKIPKAPWPGTPLSKRSSPRWTPTADDISRCYQSCSLAGLSWPPKYNAAEFWRCAYVLLLWTGLRRNDVFFRLAWDMVSEDAIRCQASKTGRVHIFPMHPIVWRHLQSLPRLGPRVFQVGNSLKQIRQSMDKISDAAGVQRIQPQAMRRASISQWEESCSAGRIIHGCARDVVSNHYLVLRKPPKQLIDGARHFRWPKEMLTAEDVDEQRCLEFRALRIMRDLRRDKLDLWIKTGEGMVG